MRVAAIVASLALAAGLGLCYALRPDAAAALTVWPAWGGALPGLGLLLLGRRAPKRLALLALLAWAAYLFVFAEEAHSLLRVRAWPAREWQKASRRGEAVRVISLNCNGGSDTAAATVRRYHPDIVLLQESPSRRSVEALTRELFGREGGFVWGADASVLARGRVAPVALSRPERPFVSHARVRLPSARTVEVISVRLLPPVFRADLYSPDCWREYARNRQDRRAQARLLAARVARLPAGAPVILGGDMNAPQGDAALWPLRARLRDAFPETGQGWGNTAINEAQVLRIDQIWISPGLTPTAVVARAAADSDHRMAIADVILHPPAR